MTTWAGHTTRDRRGQRGEPCPYCGRLHYLSLSDKVIAWLKANPGESLLTSDIAIKWDVSHAKAWGFMHRAYKAGKVAKGPDSTPRDAEWVLP